MKNFIWPLIVTTLCSTPLLADLKVYGPGGPAPVMKECAAAYSAENGTKVDVTAGPMESWIDQAPSADLFFSGSENMMDSFSEKIPFFDGGTIKTRYIRPSAILVRPKNPKKITGVKDLVNKKLKVIVVNGAGQVGMWEDIVGGLKSVDALNKFRENIVFFARSTGEAEKKWKTDDTIDAWLVFNIWGTRNPDDTMIIKTEKNLTIYRSMGTALSNKTSQKAEAQKFADYVSSPTCRKIFEKAGWSGPGAKL